MSEERDDSKTYILPPRDPHAPRPGSPQDELASLRSRLSQAEEERDEAQRKVERWHQACRDDLGMSDEAIEAVENARPADEVLAPFIVGDGTAPGPHWATGNQEGRKADGTR